MTIHTPMSSQHFQDLSTRLTHLGTHLLRYVQEQRSSQEQGGINPSSLIELEKEIKKYLNALERQTYEVAVIAAMKAGKSTLLNAVIGADVLASESEACTVCRTEIRHVKPGVTPYLLEYRVGEAKPTVIAEGEAEEIRQAFLNRTHEIRKANAVEEVESFVLHYPIAAIQDLKVLSGFTLIDTPGPNEWETEGFNTVSLKQVALEVLRNCQVILFVLDYTSFKDNTNKELLSELIEKRQDFLEQDRDKLYFLLNKVDRKAENDRPIQEVVAELKATLQSFGIPDPKVYTSSARQGLLARLILQGQAKEEHIKDFKKFFSAQYAQENEDGDLVIPGPKKIAPQALIDSGIPQIEESVIATIAQNAGMALLSEILAQLNGVAVDLEGLLQIAIQGWSIAVEDLGRKLEGYVNGVDRAQQHLGDIQKKLLVQQSSLTKKLNNEVDQFAAQATSQINEVLDILFDHLSTRNKTQIEIALYKFLNNLLPSLRKGTVLGQSLKFDSQQKAEEAYDQINQQCTPVIQGFWLATQDKLMRAGNLMRGTVAREIETEVQALANELASILGESLEFSFQPTQIQIPNYDFVGIEKKVQKQRKANRSRKSKKCCSSSDSYTSSSNISYDYMIHFADVKQGFAKTIKDQKVLIQKLIRDVVYEQIDADLKQAQAQFTEAFQRVQREIEQIIQQRHDQSDKAPQAIATLQKQLAIVREYQQEIDRIKQELSHYSQG